MEPVSVLPSKLKVRPALKKPSSKYVVVPTTFPTTQGSPIKRQKEIVFKQTSTYAIPKNSASDGLIEKIDTNKSRPYQYGSSHIEYSGRRHVKTEEQEKTQKQKTALQDKFINGVKNRKIQQIIGIGQTFGNIMISQPDGNKISPLHVAVKNDDLSMVTYLLGLKSVNVNAGDNHEITALHTAVLKGNIDIITLLLENSNKQRPIDINIQESVGNTPLHVAVLSCKKNGDQKTKQVITLLVNHQAKLTIKNDKGKTPLDIARDMQNQPLIDFLEQFEVTYEKQAESIRPKQSKQAEQKLQRKYIDNFGKSIMDDNVEGAQTTLNSLNEDKKHLLLDMSISISPEDFLTLNILQHKVSGGIAKKNIPALHIAVHKKSKKMIQFLIENGANINILDKADKNTPLHIAVKKGLTDVVDLLLKNEADKTLINIDGKTPFDIATKKKYQRIIKLFEPSQDKQQSQVKQEKLLRYDDAQISPDLYHAVVQNKLQSLQPLVNDENINIQDEKNGATLLHYAVLYDRTDIVRYLLEMGAAIDIQDNKGLTSFNIAFDRGNMDIIQLLFKKKNELLKKELLICIYKYLYDDWEKHRSMFHGWWSKDKIHPTKFPRILQLRFARSYDSVGKLNQQLIKTLETTSNLSKRKTLKDRGAGLKKALQQALQSIDKGNTPTLTCKTDPLNNSTSLQGIGQKQSSVVTPTISL